MAAQSDDGALTAAQVRTPSPPDDTVLSERWAGPAPLIGVVISTYGRAGYLRELLECLEAQTIGVDAFEVVIVDNGSADGTWSFLRHASDATPLRLFACRLEHNRGPGGGRNVAAHEVRAPIIAITDDDCLPGPGWLQGLVDAFAEQDVQVVQGLVHADPKDLASMAPWDHTIWVGGPTPFFETCNVAYRRVVFEEVGGFDEVDPLLHPKSGRAFGEDACLGWSVHQRGGRRSFAADAVVYHRCVPGTFGQWLRDQRQLRLFPGLARRTPLLQSIFYRRVFLSPISARFDLAVLGVLAAALLRRPAFVLAALPWLRVRWRTARQNARGRPANALHLLLLYALSDATALVSMLEGSARYRRLLL